MGSDAEEFSFVESNDLLQATKVKTVKQGSSRNEGSGSFLQATKVKIVKQGSPRDEGSGSKSVSSLVVSGLEQTV